MATACLAFLCCIWEPVKEALLGFWGTSVTDSLSFLRDRAVEAIRSRTVLWGNRIQRLPSSTPSMVGREQLLSDIQGLLKGDGKGIIGLYGMGGVGKTTLLIEINNKLRQSRDNSFDVVIWVTVSKDKTVFKIQEDIGARLGFSRAGEGGSPQLPTHEHDRRLALDKALFGKKFLLLLDDMWEAVDLHSVGVPHPSNGAKIVLTTRSWNVCVQMKADEKVKVDCLNKEGSWELFCSKVGDAVDLNKGSVIRPWAEAIVSKCGGVPLALIAAGGAMSGETSIPEWDKAVLQLNQSPHQFRGEVMEKQVFSVLQLSFDRLPHQWIRQCLLYCSLFPEDHDIKISKLIELWVGEGFLDSDSGNHTSLSQARDEGERIIDTLKKACLLEDGGHGSARHHEYVRLHDLHGYVRLHDLVREMALWLTDKTYKTFVLQESHEKLLGGSAEVESWEDATRISMFVQVSNFDMPCPKRGCPKLITMLVTSNHRWISVPIASMRALRVLDLSLTTLSELPSAIGLLVELRHLNLHWADVRSLPEEMGQLVNLRQLNLSKTYWLKHVPRAALVTLRSLQSLNLIDSAYKMTWREEDEQDDRDGREEDEQDDRDGVCLSGWEEDEQDDRVGREEDEQDDRDGVCLSGREEDEQDDRDGVCLSGWELEDEQDDRDGVCLRDLEENLGELEELGLDIATSQCLQHFVDSQKFQRCTRMLGINQLSDFTFEDLSVALERLRNLEFLEIAICRGLEGVWRVDSVTQLRCLKVLSLLSVKGLRNVEGYFPWLKILKIIGCDQLNDLNWAGGLPRLEELVIYSCSGMVELSVGDEPRSFLMLREMDLYALPELMSISKGTLLFPSLEKLTVTSCPGLRRLPLGLESGKKMRHIVAEREWWDALEWDNSDTHDGDRVKSAFTPYFVPY